MGDVKTLNVEPDMLRRAAEGINGVIEGISGGAFGSYEGQLGRGFSDLSMGGREMSHADSKAGFDEYLERWEWGTRAVIVAASQIGSALNLAAGRFELQDEYYVDAGNDIVNDLVGDPSLQKESQRDQDGTIVVRGTDDMSFDQMTDHNTDRLANPDSSQESFDAVRGDVDRNLDAIEDNSKQAVINAGGPGGLATAAVDGLGTSPSP